MKKIFCLLVLGLLIFGINTARALEVSDVQNDHWAASQIANVLNKGYMGFENGYNFAPDSTIKRSEFVHSLLKVIRSEDIMTGSPTKFKDVDPSTQYDQSILTSEQLRLIFGYPDYTFKPEQPILRSEANAVIANVTKGFYGDINVLEGFADKDQIPNWALYSYIKNVVNNLYVNHPDPNYFRPNDYLTRSEAAVLFSEVEKQINLVEVKYRKTAQKTKTEFLGTNTLKLVEGAPRNTVGLYNTKIVIEAGNVILAKPAQPIDSKKLEVGDQLVFVAPTDVYTQEGTFLYPAGTQFVADVQKIKRTPFRLKKQKNLIVLRKFYIPSGVSHEMGGVTYTTDKGKIVTTKTVDKKSPVKENYFEDTKNVTKAEFRVKYTDKLSPVVKYDLKGDEICYILLTGDMVIPNEHYWQFEVEDESEEVDDSINTHTDM